jgi:chaperonin GroEL (HSP60 family)
MNVRTRQIEDFFETGVIDATKVVVSAIENAVDVAALVLLNNVVIVSE